MAGDIYTNPDIPPVVTSSGTVIPAKRRRSPIESLIGKKDFGVEPLKPEDYYPTLHDPVQIGQFSGKYIGSLPQYSGAGAVVPYAIVDARRRALEQAAALSRIGQEAGPNEPLPELKATTPEFQDYMVKNFNDTINKIKSQYPSEAAFQSEYNQKGAAFDKVKQAAVNAESFTKGVDMFHAKRDEVAKAEQEGKYVPNELRQQINEIGKGADLGDPNMVGKLTNLFNTQVTENLQPVVFSAAEQLGKNITEQYTDIQKLVDNGALSETDAEGRRQKVLSTNVTPAKIKGMADDVYTNHKAGAINALTTKEERDKLDEDGLAKITQDRLQKQIKDALPIQYKQFVEGSAPPTGSGADKDKNYTVDPVSDQKKGIGAAALPQYGKKGQLLNEGSVLEQTTTAKNVWPLKVPISAQLNNAKIYDIEKGMPVNMLGDVKVTLSTIQELPYITDADGGEHILTDETRKNYPRLQPQYKRFASALIDQGSESSTEGSTRTTEKNYSPVYIDYDSVKGILDERKIKLNEPGGKSAEAEKPAEKKFPLPAGKPATVNQNGHTYTWNEQTGQYE